MNQVLGAFVKTIFGTRIKQISERSADSQAIESEMMKEFRRRSSSMCSTSTETTCTSDTSMTSHDFDNTSSESPRIYGILINSPSTTSTSDNSCAKKSVRFDTIQIQEYPYILGDNPTTSGPPLTIDFTPQSSFFVDLDAYESAKPPPRSPQQMRFDDSLRLHILLQSGHTLKQIMDVIVENRRIQAQRNESIQSSLPLIKLQRASRSMKKALPSLHTKSVCNMTGYCSNIKTKPANNTTLLKQAVPCLKRSPQTDNLKAILDEGNDKNTCLQHMTFAPTCV